MKILVVLIIFNNNYFFLCKTPFQLELPKGIYIEWEAPYQIKNVNT